MVAVARHLQKVTQGKRFILARAGEDAGSAGSHSSRNLRLLRGMGAGTQ